MEKLKNVVLKVTDLCNFNCSYCFESKEKKNRVSRFTKEKELLEFLKKFDYEDRFNFYFFGGEMFLFPDRVEAICNEIKKLERFKETKIHFAFITNASIPDKVIDLIKKDLFDLEMCKISWDGLRSHVTRGYKTNINDPMFSLNMIENIKDLSPYCRDKVLISMAVTKDNINTLYHTYEFLNKLKYRKFEYYYIFDPVYEKEYNTISFTQELYNQLIRIVGKHENFTTKLHNYELYKGRYDYAYQCRTLGNQLHIDTEGDIWACTLFPEMEKMQTKEDRSKDGNICDNLDIEQLMNSYGNIKQSVAFKSKEFCQDIICCHYRHFCNTCPLEIISFKLAGNYCPIKELRIAEYNAFLYGVKNNEKYICKSGE